MAKLTIKPRELAALKLPELQLKAAALSIGKEDLRTLGNQVVTEMKKFISRGVSPIRQAGRFPEYKTPERYPRRVQRKYPDKKNRPVNLKLSGKFLDDLKVTSIRLGSNPSFNIGYSSSLSKQKEQGHREGANGQLKRPTIPNNNEEFVVSIQKIITDEMIRRINKTFNQK